MQIRSKVHACREYALLVLAFALAIKLFPPFGEIVHRGFVIYHDLDGFTLPVECIPHCRILIALIHCHIIIVVLVCCIGGTPHHLIYIDACHCYRQQSHSCQHRKPPAYIVGYHKALISFFVRQFLQCASGFVGGRIYPFGRLFLAVFALEIFPEHSECNGWLSGRA